MIKAIISFIVEKLKIDTVCNDTQAKEINKLELTFVSRIQHDIIDSY